MADFLRPDPVLVAFIFVTQFVACKALLSLAFLRVVVGRGAGTRCVALMCALGCAAMIWTAYAPLLEMTGSEAYGPLRRLQAWHGGAPVVLGLSALLWGSAILPGARWRGIDLLHGMTAVAYLGLWGYVSWA
ncbi:MAG: hypothetical protein ACPGFC_07010 [Paracoccaceae bacterium]